MAFSLLEGTISDYFDFFYFEDIPMDRCTVGWVKRGTVMMGNLTHDKKLKFEKKAKIGWN